MKIVWIFSSLFLTGLSSCATISKEDCKKDMKFLGYTQGVKGLQSLSEEIAKVCLTKDSTVNLEAYERGFALGWSEYCSPFHGFETGKRGDLYRSFCPPEKEELFKEKFLIGKKIYEKKDQLVDLESKVHEISSDAERDSSRREELNKLKENILELNREIQALELKGLSPVHSD